VASFGIDVTPIEAATHDYESCLATWREWQPVSVEAYSA
jgi:hypothetical protein